MKIPLMNLDRLHKKIRPEIDKAIAAIIDQSHFINGPELKQFEGEFAKASGLKNVIGCANGTDAITVLLKALGVGAGDEVIVPTMTFIASSEAVSVLGAKVVFADSKPGDYTIDPEQIKKLITKKTKAIIAVHLHGNPADMTSICEIAKKHNIVVIEDSAQAHLAKHQGQPIGSFGIAATFSFFPGKNLGALGDAGAIGTNDDELALKLRKLVNHGRMGKYEHDMEGYNMRLDTLQAAVLSVKLKYLAEMTEKRRANAAYYDKLLASPPSPLYSKAGEGEERILPQKGKDGDYNVYHLYVIRVKNRDAVLEKLKNAGIEAGVHYPLPLHLQPAYKYLGYKQGDFPVAEACANEFISLPLCSEITKEEQEYVVKNLLG